MKKIVIVLMAMTLTSAVFAQNKNKKMTFEVNGKCDMCKTRIEKAALQVNGVKFADWSIPTHELSLIVDERKTNAMAIKMAIAEVGHDSKELKATQTAYDDIHPCCKYREDNTDDGKQHQ